MCSYISFRDPQRDIPKPRTAEQLRKAAKELEEARKKKFTGERDWVW